MNKRTPLAAASVAVAVLGATAAMTTPASALSWSCKTSSKTIDDAGYSGPWADNWDVKIKVCAARSGGYGYGRATISWDAPPYYQGATGTFDGAQLRLFLVRPDSAATVTNATYNIEYKLEHSNSSGNGSWTTPTIKAKTSKRIYADTTLRLDWNNDGRGYRNYEYTGTPSV
ncbi:hypothetical protein AB0D34_07975 [Streptomyces sp. NPDC048420]|uniref:hypothetical protein n=1 Tax=Streptomyces sp. NPDC048420 TaxID=3155755 RepID=UPI003438DEFC